MTHPAPTGAVVDDVDIDAVHAAVSACPAVARVGSPGVTGLATYLPGRRISGIRVNPHLVEIEVVAVWQSSVADIEVQVRGALRSLLVGRRLDITVADIDLPAEDTTPVTDSPSPAADEPKALASGRPIHLLPALPESGSASESEL